ncbi:MAG: 2-amino-4-hydroxy-6-hydroxymethyldihydropteridine diphosphokinase [Steroidobacteraceae bacterium]
MLWTPVYVALGSNLDEPREQIAHAFDELAKLADCRLIARSRLYATRPLGPQDQPDFVNAVAGMLTQLEPSALLERLQSIEKAMGKQSPNERWGARRIDLDLIVFGNQTIQEPALQVPHPGVPTRNFVLYPLLDIAPELSIPGHGRVADLALRVGSDGIAPLP